MDAKTYMTQVGVSGGLIICGLDYIVKEQSLPRLAENLILSHFKNKDLPNYHIYEWI